MIPSQIAHFKAILPFTVDPRQEVTSRVEFGSGPKLAVSLSLSRLLSAPLECICLKRPIVSRPVCTLYLLCAVQVRTLAASSLQGVLSAHAERRCDALGQCVSEFCHSVLRACTAKETVQAGLLVEFLKAGLPLLSPPVIASVCEAVLRLFTLAAVSVLWTAMCYDKVCLGISSAAYTLPFYCRKPRAS